MAAAPQTGMEKPLMKRLLLLSKKEPVNCAIAKGADAAVGFLMIDKIKNPMAMEKLLIGQFKDAKDVRRGTAVVDEEVDAKLVRFLLNKPVSGMARRLIKTLKGTGFTKVELCTEDGAPFETVQEEEDGAQEDQGEQPVAPEMSATPPPPPPPPPAPPIDIAALRARLGGLIQKIAAAAAGDAGKLDMLKGLAGTAAGAVKGNDGPGALTAINQLEEALNGAPGSGVTPIPGGAPVPVKGESFVRMQKSRLLWDSARKRVAGEIDTLKKAVASEFAGDPEENVALGALTQLDDILTNFDTRLIDTLDDMLNETDPAKHDVLLGQAKDVISAYTEYADSNPLLGKLNGDTPFGAKLTIGATITATLKALQASVH